MSNAKAEREELNASIDEFLKERRKSRGGGGWAKIEREDLTQLNSIIEMLVRLKSETDADGALTIEWELINRRTHERPRFMRVPYDHVPGGVPSDEQAEIKAFVDNYEVTLLNLNTAIDDFHQADRLRQHHDLVLVKRSVLPELCKHGHDIPSQCPQCVKARQDKE